MSKKKPRCTSCRTRAQRRGLYGLCRRCWKELPETMRQRLRAGRLKHFQGPGRPER